MEIDSLLLQKYNYPVPRYTSYPPANHFSADFGEENFLTLLEQSNTEEPEHLSFYFHIPFCSKLCFYCGCNSYTAKSEEQAARYFRALKREVEIITERISSKRKIAQIHFGGGTPNAVDAILLSDLVKMLTSKFGLIDQPEIAIECHPGLLTYDYIDILKGAGFNRFSIGIQDFKSDVLKAVNRDSSLIDPKKLVDYIRKDRPDISVNLDFIYGLPLQTPDSFSETIQKAIEIKPDRVVTFSYAHVPWMKKLQSALEKYDFPTQEDKTEMFTLAHKQFEAAGYKVIGLDHFVLPDDELYLALQHGKLHRNFQGYCTKRTTGQVYAFGVTAISQLKGGFAQNVKDVETYISTISNGKLPIERGYKLNQEEMVVSAAISSAMCNLRVNWQDIADTANLTTEEVKKMLNFSTERYRQLQTDGMVEINTEGIEITLKGAFFVRVVAATFDKFFNPKAQGYSKTA